MAGTAEVLQEYLVSLGFRTDVISLRKFEDGLGVTGKRILKVGGAVAGVVAAVEASTAAFAYSMRKMYFASELSQSSVKNLKAMEYAGKQIGVSGDTMAGAIHSMAQAMRLNPGLQGLIESFGVKVTGRDMSDVMVDFVGALKNMPEFAGAQYAQMFGIDPDTYHQMINHMDTLKQKKQELLDQYKNSGVDPDAAKKTMLEYTSAMDAMESKLSILGQAIMIKFAPQFRTLTSILNESMDWWIGWANGINSVSKALDGLSLKSAAGFLKDLYHRFTDGDSKKPSTPAAAPSASKPAASGPRNVRNNNPGNIRYGAWAKQHGAVGADDKGFAIFPNMQVGFAASNALLANYGKRGTNTVAEIIGKWAPKNENNTAAYTAYVAKSMGVNQNQPLNMNDPAVQTALSGHIAKYEGMPASMVAANTSRLGAGAPRGGVTIQQNTNIAVTGIGAESTAKAVAKEQTRVNGDMVRNLKPSVV